MAEPSIEELIAIAGPPNAEISSGSVRFSSQDESPMGSPGLNVEELIAIAGPPKNPSFLDSVVTGAKSAPGAAIEMVKDIPFGIKNLFDLPGNLVSAAGQGFSLLESEVLGEDVSPTGKTAQDYLAEANGDREEALILMQADQHKVNATNDQMLRTFEGIKNLGLGAAGFMTTGPFGATAIPYIEKKFEEGIPSLFNKPLTSLEEDKKTIGEDLGRNAVFSLFGKAVEKTGNASSNLRKTANSLDRKSLGTRQSDYGTKSETRTIETPNEGIETFVKKTLDDLVENNKLGKSRDPSDMLTVAKEKTKPLNAKIDKIVKDYDANVGTPVYPTFDNAMKYIRDKVPAKEVDAYIKDLKELDQATQAQGGGTLEYLQKQKKVYSGLYDPAASSIRSGFDTAIYHDFKAAIEKAAPETKGLNAELQKYIIAQPILKRSLTAQENASPLSKARDMLYTTGGVGAPTMIGAKLGGPVGAAAGFGIGVTGKWLASPSGQAAIARGLRTGSKVTKPVSAVAKAITPAAKLLGPAVQADTKSRQPTAKLNSKKLNQSFPKSTPSKELFKGRDMDEEDSLLKRRQRALKDLQANNESGIKKIEAIIDSDPIDAAIYEFESSRDPSAKNPKSTASGGFQLLKGTAKALGVKDPFDLKQNYEGYLKLRKENQDRFKTNDPALIYSAHYLGAPVLEKYIQGKPLKEEEQEQVDYLKNTLLPRFLKLYAKITSKTVEA